jgi:hypothetical protein
MTRSRHRTALLVTAALALVVAVVLSSRPARRRTGATQPNSQPPGAGGFAW